MLTLEALFYEAVMIDSWSVNRKSLLKQGIIKNDNVPKTFYFTYINVCTFASCLMWAKGLFWVWVS